jgi:hypothetical protein
MARAYGANARLAAAFEATYGTPPAGGYSRLPFVSCSLGSEQGLIASDLLGYGRDPLPPIRDVITDAGEIVVPLDLRAFGHWLKLLFGDPTTTTLAGVHTHEFRSGATALPSMAIEIGMPEVPRWFMHAGVRANTLSFRMQRSGAANATINLIAQGETAAGASGAGTPADIALTRFNQFQAEIRRDGTSLANVVGGEVSYSNNLDPIEALRPDGKISGADPTVAALTGSIEVRFADTALLDAATNGDAIELVFSYRIDDDRLFRLSAHEVHLPKPKLAISGPGGVQASFSWQAARSAVVGRMATAVLVNDVESYIA